MNTSLSTSAVRTFAARLLDDLLARSPGENVFFSPVSVLIALSALANGAAGETFQAIASSLGLPDATPAELNLLCKELWAQLEQLDVEAYDNTRFGQPTEPRVRAEMANGLWLSHRLPFAPGFADTLRETYRTEVAGADFGAPETAEIIDRWVSERTAGSIKEIAGRLDPRTVMLLVNAVYFKGGWASVFEPAMTEEAIFTLPDGSQVHCDLMRQSEDFFYAQSDELQLVVLPFFGSRMGRAGGAYMVVVLPRPGRSPSEALARLGSSWLPKSMELRGRTAKVNLALPRFRIACEVELSDPLAALGMGVAFDQDRADFTNLTPARPTFISEVKHTATLLVNEEGAEASGATAVQMMTLGATPEPVEMRVDRPFICAIVAGKEWTPLFLGVINSPERTAAAGG